MERKSEQKKDRRMTIFLVGISCVGKTSVGRALSEMLDIPFADLDHEVEQHFGTPLERLQQRLGTMDRFRRERPPKLCKTELLKSGKLQGTERTESKQRLQPTRWPEAAASRLRRVVGHIGTWREPTETHDHKRRSASDWGDHTRHRNQLLGRKALSRIT